MAFASLMVFSCSSQNQNDRAEPENKTTETKLEDQQEKQLMFSKIKLHDLADNILGEVANKDELSLFATSWQKKILITFIKKPELSYRLTLYRNGKEETWLFDGSNLVTREGKNNTGYYSLPELNVFKKFINPQY